MIALLLSLALAEPEKADDQRWEFQAGSRSPKPWKSGEREQREVRQIQAAYGDCVVKKHYAASRDFVLTPSLEGREWHRAVAKVGDEICLLAATNANGDVKMGFPGDTMRYTLADALFRREFAVGAPRSLKDAGPIPQPVLDESKYVPKPGKKARKREIDELAEDRIKQVARVFLAHFGECVVRTETVKSHALLMSEPNSPQESAAFVSLKPAFGSCLTAGQSLSFNKATLRGTIAMNFYRLAQLPRTVAAPAGATK